MCCLALEQRCKVRSRAFDTLALMDLSYISRLVLSCIILWLVAIFRTSDGSSITWYEPPPSETVTDPAITSTTQKNVTKGFLNEELSCTFNLTADLSLVAVSFEFGFTPVASYFQSQSSVNSLDSRFNATWVPNKLTLIVFNVTGDNKGEYLCKVQFFSGALKTWLRKITVDVLVQPQITNITGATVTEGGNVSLTCSPEGNPPPIHTWTRLSDNSVVTMPLTNISRQDAGEYRCTAANGVGKRANKTVWLIVQYKPDNVSLNIQFTNVCAGRAVTFTCSASAANPSIQNYTLYKFVDELSYVTSNEAGVFIQTLYTKGQHNYRCEGSNLLGSTSSINRSLVVHVPASVTIENDSIVVLEGRNVTLYCLPSGFPPPNISWIDSSKHVVEEGSMLKFINISRHKNGSYTCLAANACGSDQKEVEIFVEFPPKVNGRGGDAIVAEGVKHTFFCPVDGNPEPHIEWYNETGAKISSEKQLEARESGCYTCVANNFLGTPVSDTQCLTVNASLTTVPPSKVSPEEQVKARIKARIKIEREHPRSEQEFMIWFEGEMDKIYKNMSEYNRTQVIKIDVRRGGVNVCFILHFTTIVTPEKGLEKLNDTLALSGTFGGFKAGDLALLSDQSTTPTVPGSSKPRVSAGPPWAIIGAAVGGVVLLAILVGVLTWWVHKRRKCTKDTKVHNSDLERHDDEGGYSQVQGAYAQSGPPAANGTDGAAEQEMEAVAAIPTYAVVDKSKKSKKLGKEKPPVYADVDKSQKKEKQEAAAIPTYASVDKSKKKKKSREEVPAVYAEVDKSKKKRKKIDDKNLYENFDEPKKEKKPGELLYADLGDFQNPSMPAVSISPQPLPAIKKADPYERTDYADITQFLKGNATLPPNDGNGDTEMKPKRPSKKEIQGNDKETPI